LERAGDAPSADLALPQGSQFPLGAVFMRLHKLSKLLPIGDFVDGAMGAIGAGLLITSGGLPFEPEVNRVTTELKDLRRFTFPHAIQRHRVDHFLPQVVTISFPHVLVSRFGCRYSLSLCPNSLVRCYTGQSHERAYRNHPLTEEQTASNREKSKTRAKVEPVFGRWVMTMGGKLVRAIGLTRVWAQLGLKNLTDKLKRYVFWQKKARATAQAQCV